MIMLAPGRGAAWLARLTGGQEVAGSNPVAPRFVRYETTGACVTTWREPRVAVWVVEHLQGNSGGTFIAFTPRHSLLWPDSLPRESCP
jgi:hypothetical protein